MIATANLFGSLRFAGQLSPIVGTLLALGGAAAVGYLYHRETKQLDAPYSFVLPLLRSVAVALVIMILTGPIWHRRQRVGTLGRVTFALDISQSMSISDSAAADASPNRKDRAARLLIGDAFQPGWLHSLGRTHEIDVVSFADGDVTSLWSSTTDPSSPTTLSLPDDAGQTDLSSPLSRLMRQVDASNERDPQDAASDDVTQARHAVVLLSDGRDTVGSSAVQVARQLGDSGVIVHTFGVGATDEPPDFGIVDVDHPENVAADGVLAGRIVLKQTGFDQKPIRLTVRSNGESVWEKQFDEAIEAGTSVPFQIEMESLLQDRAASRIRGVQRSTIILDLIATVEVLTPEKSVESISDRLPQNNQFPFRVGASVRNRQLLILDGSSRWEIRYLRNLFGRDPAWDVTTILFGPGTDQLRLVRGEQPGQFPSTDQAWAKYDALILGEVPPEQLTPNDAYQLKEFVTRGGGLILIDGRYDRMNRLSEGIIADLIPVQYIDGQPRIEVRSIRPTALGLDQDAMNLTGESTSLSELWEILPSPKTAGRVRASEGAEVWADAVGVDGREAPWLVTRLFGAGRVFFVSSDETWRWRYKVADRFHARFWNQLLAAAVQPPYSSQDDFVSIATDRIEYNTGASPRVRVRLQDPSGEPVGDATVDALFISNDPGVHNSRVVATVPLDVEDPLRGTYEGRSAALPAGAYTIRVRASGFDESSFLASTPIWIGQNDRRELDRLSLDIESMSNIAKSSGGEYFHESHADELLNSLKPLSSGSIVESDTLLWQSCYWFAMVIVVLAAEWWLRKKVGLV
tara:strand:- start:420910 stop:423315 length:2406 start_codon:yes stop_codon:yes gene_type:complete